MKSVGSLDRESDDDYFFGNCFSDTDLQADVGPSELQNRMKSPSSRREVFLMAESKGKRSYHGNIDSSPPYS